MAPYLMQKSIYENFLSLYSFLGSATEQTAFGMQSNFSKCDNLIEVSIIATQKNPKSHGHT